MPGPPNSATGFGGAPFGSTIVPWDLLDFLDKPAKRPSEGASEFELNLIGLGSDSATSLPANATRGSRVLRVVVLGEKIVKLVFGTSEEGDANSIFTNLDAIVPAGEPDRRQKFLDIVNRSKQSVSAAGWTLLDPVWLADPPVGG